MKHVIIGTAGHVDHGKTCLIKALTGIDTDRLKEEKKRGITIELGFAYLDLSNGRRVGIIDVPGHEKFVKNMLSGAGGMDLAMLVVAADEGVMPQTVEHLEILSILGIRHGVIVLTKCDLVEPDFLELVKEEVQELIQGTFLEQAPILPVSAYEGKGIQELRMTLEQLCEALPERALESHFRLPVDRIFTLKGFGTVVTGTLMEGKIKKDQEVMLYPEELPVKIRSIQVHSQGEETAYAGQRAAVNLPDCKKDQIKRGDVLATRHSLFPTRMLDVRVEILPHAEHTIRQGARVHIYHGTKELLGKVCLMDKEELKAGESGYAQLRLEEKTVAKKGDHFVLRFYSPVETLGGGVILDACPKKHRKSDPKALEAFAIKETGSQKEQLALAALEHMGCFYSLTELTERCSLDRSRVKNLARKLVEEQSFVQLEENLFIHREELKLYEKKVVGFLDDFHKAFPLKEGMGLEEVRSRMNLKYANHVADEILEILKSEKKIKEHQGLISKYRFRVVVKEDEDAVIQEIIQYYLKVGFAPLTTELYAKEHEKQKKFRAIFTSLLNKKILIRLDGQYCIHADYYQKAKEAFEEMTQTTPVVSLGAYRDHLGCSRKIAVAILEHFDKNGFTRKTEEGRIWKAFQKNEGVK